MELKLNSVIIYCLRITIHTWYHDIKEDYTDTVIQTYNAWTSLQYTPRGPTEPEHPQRCMCAGTVSPARTDPATLQGVKPEAVAERTVATENRSKHTMVKEEANTPPSGWTNPQDLIPSRGGHHALQGDPANPKGTKPNPPHWLHYQHNKELK